MRDIKFRGFQNEWEYGGYSNCFGEYQIINDTGSYQVDEKSIGQYTGLKDKNGKEIYEGDILKLPVTKCDKTEGEIISWVSYDNVEVGFCSKVISGPILIPGATLHFGAVVNKELEVIGNIYENPEMLQP